MSQKLLTIGEMALRHAEHLGAEQTEVYLAISRSFSVDVENSAIKRALERRDAGVGIRTVLGKRVGFAYVTTLQKADVLEAADNSVALARASIDDPDFATLPSFEGKYPAVRGLFDRNVDELTADDTADLVVRVVDASKGPLDKMKYAIDASISSSSGTKVILNSLGVSCHVKTTSISIESQPSIKTDTEQTSSSELQVGRRLASIDPEWVGESASRNVLANLGGKTIEGGEMPVIFAPHAMNYVLGQGLAGALSAEEIHHGRSYISDAFGQEIASPSLRIVDDGLLAGGIGSRRFDAEGMPSQRTDLILSGVLKSILHNSYTAFKDRVHNTANAGRPSYAGVPSISTSNFVVLPGSGSLDDLVEEVSRGVICMTTGDTPNMTTGDLSAMLMEGRYIEGGAIKHPLKNTLVGINMRDLLKRVVRVGADTRVLPDSITPSVLVECAKITSG